MNKFRVLLLALALMALLIAGCAGGGDTAAPAAEDAAADTEAAEEAPAADVVGDDDVPRNRTMVVADMVPYGPPEMWSPYNLGGTHQQGQRAHLQSTEGSDHDALILRENRADTTRIFRQVLPLFRGSQLVHLPACPAGRKAPIVRGCLPSGITE